MVNIIIPKKAERILDTLHQNGFEAYVVGGCVRDSILGRTPGDWDITTSASPHQVKALFPRTIDTGIEHGTVTVMMEQEGFEVTTFRIDGDYEDGRHPKEVSFTSSLTEDLKRRDFTINAMAYSNETGLIDEFGGLEDIEKEMIRCVGTAKERFSEDALRMMRAVRFAAQLGFSLDPEVVEAIKEMAEDLRKISAERIQVELVKILVSDRPEWIELAYDCGITNVILPEFDRIMVQRQNNPHHNYSTGVHTLIGLKNIPADKALRLTMLFHDMGKPDVFVTDAAGIDHFHGHAAVSAEIAKAVLKRLKFDNHTTRKVITLVKNHSIYPKADQKGVRMSAYEIGPEFFPDFLLVKKADIMAHHPDVIEKKLAYLAEVVELWEGICQRSECISLKMLHLSGSDLIEDGMQKGKEVGEILQQLLMEVIEEPSLNNKEKLLERSRILRSGSQM